MEISRSRSEECYRTRGSASHQTSPLGSAKQSLQCPKSIRWKWDVTSGKDPSGRNWEAQDHCCFDKLGGKKHESPEWERFGKYRGDWEHQAMRTGEAFRKELKIKELKQTGSIPCDTIQDMEGHKQDTQD